MTPARADAVPLVQVVYSEFLDLVNTGNVRQARIDESLQKVSFSVRPLQQAGQQDAPAEASTSGSDHGHGHACTYSGTGVQSLSSGSNGVTLHMHVWVDHMHVIDPHMHVQSHAITA